MRISKNPFFEKWLKIATTLVVILTFIFGANAPALANPDLQIEPLDENYPDGQELPQDNFEDFPRKDLESGADYKDVLASAETFIDKERLHFFSLTMPQLENRERNVIVYLPSDYQTGNNSYEVIYVLDAQNLFVQSSFSPEDRILNEALFQFYTQDFDGEAIVVGIESDPIYTWDEYSPWVNQDMYLWVDPYEANQVEGGEGDAFLDFMEQTLKPSIDERYRTLTDRENSSIGGTKMGGLLSIYAGLTRPEVYSNVMAMSPSIWFAESGQEWLSGNHLLILIDREGVPENVSFSLDVDLGNRLTDQVKDLDAETAVMDSQGSKISFSQVYVEGTQAILNGLTKRGYASPNISSEVATPTEPATKTEEILNEILVDGEYDYLSYLPLIMKPALISPQITSASSTTFTKSSASSFIITTSGYPVPIISISGSFPAGITFTDIHNGTAKLSGTPTATGTYTLTITAQNGVAPNTTQTFILKVIASPLITSASSATFTQSSLSSFTIASSGYPVPMISISGSLPAGITFTDDGNGTARIYGTPTTAGMFTLTISAQNGVEPNATQTFTLKVVEGCPDSGNCLITFSMNMSSLNRSRNITVYLPPNYNSGEYYPVMYHTDAQHIFGTQIAPAIIDDVDWKMDEILDSYYYNTGKGIIAVGVWYDYDYPWSEYTITRNRNMDHWVNGASQLITPEGGGMINFIRYVLKPEIDSRFHTLTDREHTAIGGGSRHALLGLYAGLLAPETFSRVMSFSPAIWIAESNNEAHVPIPGLTTWYAENGLDLWLKNHQAPTNVKYFIYVGGNEVSGLHYPYVEKVAGSGKQISIQYAYESGYVRVTGVLNNVGIPTENKSFIFNPGGTHLPKIWRPYLIPHMLPFFGY